MQPVALIHRASHGFVGAVQKQRDVHEQNVKMTLFIFFILVLSMHNMAPKLCWVTPN